MQSKGWKMFKVLSLVSAVCAVMTACGGGGGGGGGGGDSGSAATGVVLSGQAAKGPMNGASVAVYALNADGSRGAVLGLSTTATDNSGKFSVTLPTVPTGPVDVSVSKGSYTSEFDGKTVNASTSMDAIVDDVPQSGVSNISVTPLSDMVAQRAIALQAVGKNQGDSLAQARSEVQAKFKLKNKPESVLPTFNNSSVDQTIGSDNKTMDQALIALETFTHSIGATDTDAVYAILSADFSDGKLDGQAKGTKVQYGKLANVTSATLDDKMYTSITLSITAVINNKAPTDLQTFIRSDPVAAESKGIASLPAGYSCSTGFKLLNNSDGAPTCWDGTKDANGAAIIGDYTECSNGALIPGSGDCSTKTSYACPQKYSLVSDPSRNPICWDGTKTTATNSIVLGTYYICSTNNAIVTSQSECPPSNIINQVGNSTTPATAQAATVANYKNSTQPATYTAPQVTPYQATVLSQADLAALPSAGSLPSWAGLGSLNPDQLNAIATETSLLTTMWLH